MLKSSLRLMDWLGVIGLAVCFNMIFTDFIGDDIGRILFEESSFQQGLGYLLQNLLSDRPVLMFTLWLNYAVGGMNPIGYKIVNVLLHILCGLSVFFLMAKILHKSLHAKGMAFFIAALFLVHPINNQAVMSVIQRGVLLSTLFAVLSFYFFIRAFEAEFGRKFHLLSVLCFLLAVASKPSTSVLPLILALYYWFEIKGNRKQLFKLLLPYLLVLLLPVLSYSVLGENAQWRSISGWDYFLIQTKIIIFYFQKYLLPLDLHFFYSFNNTFPQPPDVLTWLALGFHAAFVTWACLQYKKHSKPWGLFVILGYLALLPESGFFPIMHPGFDHRNYFPLVFFAAAFVSALAEYRRSALKWAGGVLVLVFAALNVSYTAKISTYEKWIFYNLRQNPTYINFYTYTAAAELRRGNTDLALRFIDECISHNPDVKEIQLLKKMALADTLPHEQQLSVLRETTDFAKTAGYTRFVFNYFEFFLDQKTRALFPFDEYVYRMNEFYQSFWVTMMKPSTEGQAISRMQASLIAGLRLNGREHPRAETFFKDIDTDRAMSLMKNLILLKMFFNFEVDLQEFKTVLERDYPLNQTAKSILSFMEKYP